MNSGNADTDGTNCTLKGSRGSEEPASKNVVGEKSSCAFTELVKGECLLIFAMKESSDKSPQELGKGTPLPHTRAHEDFRRGLRTKAQGCVLVQMHNQVNFTLLEACVTHGFKQKLMMERVEGFVNVKGDRDPSTHLLGGLAGESMKQSGG